MDYSSGSFIWPAAWGIGSISCDVGGHLVSKPTQIRMMCIQVLVEKRVFSCRLGVPPGTDWEQLTSEGLWTAWSPLLIHIIAHGLLTILRGLLNLLISSTHWCLAVKRRHTLAALLAVLWLPSSMLCGAMGLCCVLGAYALTVSSLK